MRMASTNPMESCGPEQLVVKALSVILDTLVKSGQFCRWSSEIREVKLRMEKIERGSLSREANTIGAEKKGVMQTSTMVSDIMVLGSANLFTSFLSLLLQQSFSTHSTVLELDTSAICSRATAPCRDKLYC